MCKRNITDEPSFRSICDCGLNPATVYQCPFIIRLSEQDNMLLVLSRHIEKYLWLC